MAFLDLLYQEAKSLCHNGMLESLFLLFQLNWRRWWRSVAGIVVWIVFAQYLFNDTNPFTVGGVIDLTQVPEHVKLWLLVAGPYWSVVGALILRQRYRQRRLDDSATMPVGGLAGFVAGPIVLVPIWFFTPGLKRSWALPVLTFLSLLACSLVFKSIHPNNLCVTNQRYVGTQIVNGLTIGILYALMAIGLTLIYSIQGIVSFAHGQFYMLGGFTSYYVLNWLGSDINPVLGILIAGVVTMVIGLAFEWAFLRPMHLGRIERASEYAILITFGLGFFIEYTVLASAGAIPRKLNGYVGKELEKETFDKIYDEIGLTTVISDRVVAGAIALMLIILLLIFIRYTWWGRALRAVSMDRQAAAVVGINPLIMNTFAFGLGTMLAGMSGAALVSIFNFTPGVGTPAAGRAYVIVVLGGLGSVPGALVGGLIIGLIEALGSGCYPDITRGSAYKDSFGLVLFAIILLIRPTGLFGRQRQ